MTSSRSLALAGAVLLLSLPGVAWGQPAAPSATTQAAPSASEAAASESAAGDAERAGAAPAKVAPVSAAEASGTYDTAHPPDGARWRVLVAGLGMFAGSYGAMAIMGATWSEVPGSEMLYIPIAGPWAALAKSGCAPDEETSVGEGDCGGMMGLRGVIYSVAGLVQLGSLGVIGESIFMTTDSGEPTKKAYLMPLPIITSDTVGVGVVGAF